MKICDKEKCTGCMNCANACPKECITMVEDNTGAVYPNVDEDKCVNCGLCRKNCPSEAELSFNSPIMAYAAWSLDNEVFINSASGGIAYEIYRDAIGKGSYVVGAQIDENHNVNLNIADCMEDVTAFQNSKYTFSYMNDIVKKIEKLLRQDKSVVMIGTGCQVSAVKTYMTSKNIPMDNLLLVDIVCHGMPSGRFFKEHMTDIKKRKKLQDTKVSFRDPFFGTNKFVLAVRNKENKIVYSKKVESNDTYQLAYHHALIYRDNCYQCKYAQPKRIGDLTISDYKGIGRQAPCDFTHGKMSSVLVNTQKGKNYIERLINANIIEAHERPITEPIQGDKQLRQPSVPHVMRDEFKNRYEITNDFEKAAKYALKKEIVKYSLINASHYKEMVFGIKKIISPSVKKRIKKVLKRK